MKNIDVPLIEEKYHIHKDGIIQHKKKPIPIKGSCYGAGYNYIDIRLNGSYVRLLRHRVIATKFIPNPENKPCVNHIDGNKLNNHFSNLEWCTHKENTKHAHKIGLINTYKGRFIGKKLEMLRYLNGKFSQSDIANLLGVTQANISKALKKT